MRPLDPGHTFLLESFDGIYPVVITFMKRDYPPEKYPGNTNSYPGTNIQEVIRALISRMNYLQKQNPCIENELVIANLEGAFLKLEERAHRMHNSYVQLPSAEEAILLKPCSKCGHILCSWC